MAEAVKVISADRIPIATYLSRVWEHRSLVTTLARRDLKAKYAQTVLGLLWAAGQPLIGLLVFTLFFDLLIDVDTGEIWYPLFAFSGMISWYYFTYLVAQAGTSVSNAQDIIKKIYFPKLVLPLSQVLVGFVDFAISVVLLIGIMAVSGHLPTVNIIFFPAFLLLNIVVGLAVGIWLAALTVRYRDFHHFIPYVVNLGIWLTPVFYPSTIIPEKYGYFLYLNPMAGVIAGFRWSVLGGEAPAPEYLFGALIMVILLVSGVWYFRNVERKIADYV